MNPPPKNNPSELPIRLLEELRTARSLPGKISPLALATSPIGLHLQLSPVQKIILALTGVSHSNYHTIQLTDPELVSHFNSLIGKNDSPQRLWLPPSARVSYSEDITIEFSSPVTGLLLIAGRRSGKTTVASIIASAIARRILRDPDFLHNLPLFETSRISILNTASESRQAEIFYKYLSEYLVRLNLIEKSPSGTEIELKIPHSQNILSIESLSSSAKSIRGRTAACVVLDEFAHFIRSTGPLADRTMWVAIIPSLANFAAKSLFIITTSPAGRSGMVWDLFSQKGIRDGMLTFQIPTWEMNPSITQKQLQPEFERDSFFARQEFGAEFLEPEGAFLNYSDILACVENIPDSKIRRNDIRLHCDIGIQHDSTALAWGFGDHSPDSGSSVTIIGVDVLSPHTGSQIRISEIESVILSLHSRFNFAGISFDQYQSAYIIERLKSKGINAYTVNSSASSNMESYSLLRNLINDRKIKIPDNPELISQLQHLQCRTKSYGFSVEAERGNHDDIADSIAALCYELIRAKNPWSDTLSIIERTA